VSSVGTQVVVLNGGSSSGKSSMARELVRLLPGPWLRLGVDTLIDALAPSPEEEADVGLVIGADGEVVVGPAFTRVERAWMRGVAAIAADVPVVVEDNFLSGPAAQQRWREALAGLDVLWVGVRCDAEARERARGDRAVGMARAQADVVHEGIGYDLEVDAGVLSPADAAAVVAASVVAASVVDAAVGE